MTLQSDIPEKAQESKARANTLFKGRDFSGALTAYEDILHEFPAKGTDDALSEFLRTILSNKAACYMELRRYGEAVTDLNNVLSVSTPDSDAPLTQKTHLRLAKCYHNLQDPDQATKALADYQKLHGRRLAEETADEEKLHLAILQSTQPAGMRAIKYDISVIGNKSDPTSYPIRFYDSVPVHICTRLSQPNLRKAGEKVLANLVNKYDTKMTLDLVKANRMICWNCGKPALSNVHSPASWLHSDPPFVMDFTQPVCSRGGTCEQEAYRYMAALRNEMRNVAA
ncbi:hypothetical protein D9619_003766 [Psilocybe cf. subviscida]|uniref:Tetratricopeptide repeat protein n=1 Tax=Psilocybe cf. subviscida TaxID=2480587 RepID=A0A8H5ETR9_9AGAR|nr:hypothetical protein D9619_003766 [Psilocybe cf. subviscida]